MKKISKLIPKKYPKKLFQRKGEEGAMNFYNFLLSPKGPNEWRLNVIKVGWVRVIVIEDC